MTTTRTGQEGVRGALLTRRGAAALCGGLLTALTALTGCTSGNSGVTGGPAPVTSTPAPTSSTTGPRPSSPTPANVYAHAGAGRLQGEALKAKPLVYVPNTLSDTLQVIDPRTYRVIARYRTGREPQHVVPSWDLRTLWVNDDLGNDLVPSTPAPGGPAARYRSRTPTTSTSPPTAPTRW